MWRCSFSTRSSSAWGLITESDRKPSLLDLAVVEKGLPHVNGEAPGCSRFRGKAAAVCKIWKGFCESDAPAKKAPPKKPAASRNGMARFLWMPVSGLCEGHLLETICFPGLRQPRSIARYLILLANASSLRSPAPALTQQTQCQVWMTLSHVSRKPPSRTAKGHSETSWSPPTVTTTPPTRRQFCRRQ